MTISLLHPSRGRPQRAIETFLNWKGKSSGAHKIEHIISIDTDDSEHDNYKAKYWGEFTKIIGGNNGCAVTATNGAAALSTGDILVMLSDDFECPQDWDKLIVEAFLSAYENGNVLKTYDGIQKWIVTLAIMDRSYYLRHGYFYYPEYKHMFCDTEMTHKAELEGRLIVRNDLIFPHNHYTHGGAKKDATNEKADKTWNQGEALYLRRVKENFGLSGVDPFNISDKNHVKWLRSKLKVYA